MSETTTIEILVSDMKAVETNKVHEREPNRDSLHRLIQAGKKAIEQAKEAGA